jgi:creatinine amidohydrolase
MYLKLASWPEVETYLTHSKGIIIPIGSFEQHGLNGIIGTDIVCPEVIADKAVRISDVPMLIGPSISVGIAQHHLGFSGSMTIRPSTLIELIKDYVKSLQVHGFNRFIFFNGHGGNISPVQAAFSEIYADISLRNTDFPDIQCKLINWFMLPRVHRLTQELYGNKEGSHATPSEVSVTQYAYPDHIKQADMVDLDPNEKKEKFTHSKHYRDLYPDGRMKSDPSLSCVEHGEKLTDLAAHELLAEYKVFC